MIAEESYFSEAKLKTGMQAVTNSFPRLRDGFVYQEGDEPRPILLSMIFLLHYRTKTVGLNQTLTI